MGHVAAETGNVELVEVWASLIQAGGEDWVRWAQDQDLKRAVDEGEMKENSMESIERLVLQAVFPHGEPDHDSGRWVIEGQDVREVLGAILNVNGFANRPGDGRLAQLGAVADALGLRAKWDQQGSESAYAEVLRQALIRKVHVCAPDVPQEERSGVEGQLRGMPAEEMLDELEIDADTVADYCTGREPVRFRVVVGPAPDPVPQSSQSVLQDVVTVIHRHLHNFSRANNGSRVR